MDSNFLAALDAFRSGEMIIVVDAHDREDEGDLIMLAERATTEDGIYGAPHHRNFMCRY